MHGSCGIAGAGLAPPPARLTPPNLPRYSGPKKKMSTRTLTPANQITILRLVFVPIFAILVIGRHFVGALAVLTAAAVSDALDGPVARVLKQETPLGVALDPIADKILMTAGYLALAYRNVLPWWLAILVVSRDIIILLTALVISLVAGYRPFYPTVLGKLSTIAQVTLLFVAVGAAAHFPLITQIIVQVCIYATAALTLASGFHYLIVCRQRFGHAP